LIDLRKIILLVFAFAEFPHSQGQNPLLPRRNIDSRFTSITGHNAGAITCAAAEQTSLRGSVSPFANPCHV